MTPIVTFLSDFGTRDSYVAETKAAVLAVAPEVTIVDLSHEVEPGNIAAAQYLLARSWHRFPKRTVHLAVVDPGVGGERRAIAARSSGHCFVAPDNGLLTPILDGAAVVELVVPARAAPTFHGRDVFGPAAAWLARGRALEELGEGVSDPRRSQRTAHSVERGEVIGEVVYIDRFGTLITNIPNEAAVAAAEATVGGEHRARWGRTFGDVEKGRLVTFAGSGGTVEIACRDGSAAALTGKGVGTEVRLRLSS
ncbi:MAG: S-adenosyl-l-methionine hydroxide adenosyltransferase family protein [Gemmatimonadales bacterium]